MFVKIKQYSGIEVHKICQWRSQNVEKVMHIKGRLLDQAVILFNCVPFLKWELLYVPSSFAIILVGKRELVALLSLSSWCLMIVVWLFLTVPLVSLSFMIVVFPDHTHFIFFS